MAADHRVYEWRYDGIGFLVSGEVIVSGITPYRTLHDIARALPTLTARDEIEAALDELEYLFEVIPPEMQEYAEPVIMALRAKLASLDIPAG